MDQAMVCNVGEPTQVFVSVWHPDRGPLSDEFAVNLTAQGMPTDVEKIGNTKTIFRDLTQVDLLGSFIVVRIISIGKIDKKGKTDFRKPFGGAVLPIPDNISDKATEFTMLIYAAKDNADFWDLPERQSIHLSILHSFTLSLFHSFTHSFDCNTK